MLISIALVFLVLWLMGMIIPHSLGKEIHLLLIIALVIILIRYIPGVPLGRF